MIFFLRRLPNFNITRYRKSHIFRTRPFQQSSHIPNVGSRLGQHCRWMPNIEPTLGEIRVFTGHTYQKNETLVHGSTMLGQRRRRWANTVTPSGQRVVFTKIMSRVDEPDDLEGRLITAGLLTLNSQLWLLFVLENQCRLTAKLVIISLRLCV